jgi:hypothetical protein
MHCQCTNTGKNKEMPKWKERGSKFDPGREIEKRKKDFLEKFNQQILMYCKYVPGTMTDAGDKRALRIHN